MRDKGAWKLRPAAAGDVEDIARVWHAAWLDGHAGHVPPSILPHRGLDTFRARVPSRLATTTVATLGGSLVGFVTVTGDELEQLFVAEEARGRGVAAALLDHGEATIFARHPIAWLAVATGNARARRFYERRGWEDRAGLDYAAEIPGGSILVPSRRYEKRRLGL
jgi:ribosomal protein S18 acetylase RimI-like enzyme